MDPMTDVFMTMRVASVVHARLEATAPWGLRREAKVATAGTHPSACGSSPRDYAHFGMVSRGNCWLSVEGIPEPLPLTGGDCFLLAPGSSYTLRDNPRTRARSFCEVAPKIARNVIHYGGGGAPTTIVSGWFQFDQSNVRPLTQLLPRLILVRADQARTLALHTTLQLLGSEMAEPAPGSEVVVNRLADVLFIQTIRAHIASTSHSCSGGWLRAIVDPQVGAALKAMHERVGDPWTVETLASAAGMSRSAFAMRFKQMLGEAPLEYLTRWRMYKATRLLRDGDKKLMEVAKLIGYESDAAFNKAFKRVLGIAPGEYRRKGTGVSRADNVASIQPLDAV